MNRASKNLGEGSSLGQAGAERKHEKRKDNRPHSTPFGGGTRKLGGPTIEETSCFLVKLPESSTLGEGRKTKQWYAMTGPRAGKAW